MTWLIGWNRRKSKIFTGTSQTDYQMKFNIHQGSETDGSPDSSRTDGSTLLNYRIESTSGTSGNMTAVTWVKIANTSEAAYIYYDNPGAPAVSNGNNTFIFFDDFLGTSLDTTKWNNNIGSVSVASSTVTLNGACNIVSKTTVPLGVSFVSRFARVNDVTAMGATDNNTTTGTMEGAFGNNAWDVDVQGSPVAARNWQCSKSNGTYSEISVGNTYDTNYHITDVRWYSGHCVWYKDSVLVNDKTDNIPTISLYPYFSSYRSRSQLAIDYLYVRKYVSPEPTYGAWGTEEAAA